ncbi:AUGMIN subunit 5 [Selaginella moellendorffii]|uniref:AUGMIN subunit 5 n=1 Tax=Selaginella moellendorffii TaxID=88036 RepID=UPI000D1C2A29|nr:AUGMIN subunit 5 [Selaginella moellendorffii]|eukprot:XP_024545326.1 AUGMIN subunit 5 [Selaginella moellendorffii]
MQGAASAAPQAEAILAWLQEEIGYRSAGDHALPSPEALRRLCRGNMLPVWKFLVERVKSDKTVETVRRNILVHGGSSGAAEESGDGKAREEGGAAATTKAGKKRGDGKFKGRGEKTPAAAAKEEKERESKALEGDDSKERALAERDSAEKEVERLKGVMARLQKDVKSRMLDLSREEGERQRVLDDKFNSRHKQVQLESFDQRCEQTVRIFAEYRRRLARYVDRAREAQRGKLAESKKEQDTVYATSIKGDDQILIETAQERSIRKACELLSAQLTEKITLSFPSYEGRESQGDAQATEVAKLGFEDGEGVAEDIREAALSLLKNPTQLLRAMATYTARVVALITKETERIDIRADAEKLRYKYENNEIVDDLSTEPEDSPLGKKLSGKIGLEMSNRRTNWQIRERQKAHVQQFMATEEALNEAAEAKAASDKLIKSLSGGTELDYVQNEGGLRQLECEVWAKERQLAGVKASVATLMSEVQRLKKLCEERKQAEDSLRQKWKRIEEFDARRRELESVYTALIRANMAAAAAWEQHPAVAFEHSANTILPVCNMVQEKTVGAQDLLEREATIFQRSPDNRLYMLPVTPQALVEAMGISSMLGPEAIAAAERNADMVAARAGAGDPSAMASICRIAAASQYSQGAEAQDAGMIAIVEALRFCLKPCSSPASLLENLARSINLVQTLRDLVGSGRALLTAANISRPDYEKTANACAVTTKEQELIALEEWLPSLKHAVLEAHKCLEDCHRVRGLVNEWWEQPAATAVDWITVDGQNAAAWLAHVKQLQNAFYEKQLL